jgi:N-acetylmuramic acid 6-phosphate etherase
MTRPRKALHRPTLKTEQPSAAHTRLDEYSTNELIVALISDQQHAFTAARAAADSISAAVSAAVPRMRAGGRLVYVGAGTSGRLGLLDCVELRPTFSWPRERALALLAGGQNAVYAAIEGAEDDAEQGAADIVSAAVGPNDVVVLIAASGTTPYVQGALSAARAAGALTVGIVNNRGAPIAEQADIGITLDTGSEAVSGSTRLKAGTAQKLALNAFSTALMVRLGRVYGNLMVDVAATNAKLLERTVSLMMHATGCDEATARSTLAACGHQVKVGIVAVLRKTTIHEAVRRLDAAHGSVRAALAD